jgi:hypothetical protein
MKENKFIIRIGLIILLLFSGFNYLPLFKISGIPIFQSLIVICILLSFLLNRDHLLTNVKECRNYIWYLLTSLPSLIIGIYFEAENSLLVYIYALFPYLLFITTGNKMNKEFYLKLLSVFFVSMFLICIFGWLIRLSILPQDIIFEVFDAEFEFGYWGIGYLESTRNHDYLYPLIGLSITLYFFLLKRNKLLYLTFCIFFIITLIASLSRGAIIISFLGIILLLKSSSNNVRKTVFLVSFSLIAFNFSLIKQQYDERYQLIINSIFTTNSISSNFSNESRLTIIQDALESSIISPFGYGINNYYSIYNSNFIGHISYTAENAYLTILVERGWLAFFYFISFFFFSIKNSWISSEINLNKILLPFLTIYYLFNYELNNVFATFVFYFVFLCLNFIKKDKFSVFKIAPTINSI